MSADVANDKKISLAGKTDKSTEENKTGSWRSFRPVIDEKKCIGCGNCVNFCPDDCIKIIEKDGKKIAVIEYDYC